MSQPELDYYNYHMFWPKDFKTIGQLSPMTPAKLRDVSDENLEALRLATTYPVKMAELQLIRDEYIIRQIVCRVTDKMKASST